MAKIAEATTRLFKNVFVCKSCQTKIKSEPLKIANGRVRCRKCGKKTFRPINRK